MSFILLVYLAMRPKIEYAISFLRNGYDFSCYFFSCSVEKTLRESLHSANHRTLSSFGGVVVYEDIC